MDTDRIGVVIPAYGLPELTQAVVRQLAEDGFPHTVFVVDNAGDYRPAADERVLAPGRNLGWLRGSNFGVEHALQQSDLTHFCLLNNDVVLARGFLAGLIAAIHTDRGIGLLAPSYDDHFPVQTEYFRGDAADFVPAEVEVATDVVDGTCMLLPRETLRTVGLLDDASFGRFGWGGADDLCLRVAASGQAVAVTRRAYLQHHTGQTARRTITDYRLRATAEMVVGMRRKYGRRWMTRFPSGQFDHHGYGLREYLRYRRLAWIDEHPRLQARRGWTPR